MMYIPCASVPIPPRWTRKNQYYLDILLFYKNRRQNLSALNQYLIWLLIQRRGKYAYITPHGLQLLHAHTSYWPRLQLSGSDHPRSRVRRCAVPPADVWSPQDQSIHNGLVRNEDGNRLVMMITGLPLVRSKHIRLTGYHWVVRSSPSLVRVAITHDYPDG